MARDTGSSLRSATTYDDDDTIDLLRLFKALWRRIWAIILAAVICGGAAFSVAAFLITPTYEASALMYVNNSSFSVGSTSFSISSSEISAAQSLVETYVVILETRSTLEDVIEAADLDYDYETLLGMIEAEAVNSTEIFSITVTSTDPEEAALIANTIAEILPDKISEIVDGSSVRVVDYAVTPVTKAAPSITYFTAAGILIGIVLSAIVIIILELSDDVIHSEDYLTQTYDVPILASIPDLSAKSKNGYYRYDSYGRSYAGTKSNS